MGSQSPQSPQVSALPQSVRPTGGGRWLEVVARLLQRPDDAWWDDRTTVGLLEGRDEILSRALTSARMQLAVDMGKEATGWEWGPLGYPYTDVYCDLKDSGCDQDFEGGPVVEPGQRIGHRGKPQVLL